MGQFFRYLLGGAAIIIIAVWIFTVLRSCQEAQLNEKINQSPTEINDQDASNLDEDSDDPGDIDYADAVKPGDEDSDEENSEEAGDDESSEEIPEDMDATKGRRLTDATAGTNNSPYLVIAGTYTSEGNAQTEVNRLNKLGYDDAEVVQFIGSRYYTVCVDRLDGLTAARQLRNKVKADNTEEVYVHRRRMPKRK